MDLDDPRCDWSMMVGGTDAPIEWPYRHFTRDEMSCNCGCRMSLMSHGFMVKLDCLREELNRPMIITSGYRCPEWDTAVGRGDGPHSKGRAADILCHGAAADEILMLSYKYRFTGRGIMQHGPHDKRFIHLDDLKHTDKRPRPTPWTYPK